MVFSSLRGQRPGRPQDTIALFSAEPDVGQLSGLLGMAAFDHLVRVRHCGRRWPGRPSADGWLLVAGCGPQVPSGHAGGPACGRPGLGCGWLVRRGAGVSRCGVAA